VSLFGVDFRRVGSRVSFRSTVQFILDALCGFVGGCFGPLVRECVFVECRASRVALGLEGLVRWFLFAEVQIRSFNGFCCRA